ncbi:MAG: DUF1801 domain-containing protein [Deinococcales bacterium]|jgi:hypothetical protein
MPDHDPSMSPSRRIDARIEGLADWRGEMLARIRRLIHRAEPDVVEQWKWRGVPVWYHDGMICTGETYKDKVKITFAKGPRSRIRRACSTPVSTATPGAPSISTTRTISTRRPSPRSCAPPWP